MKKLHLVISTSPFDRHAGHAGPEHRWLTKSWEQPCDDTVTTACWSYKISYHSITGRPLLNCLCMCLCVLVCESVLVIHKWMLSVAHHIYSGGRICLLRQAVTTNTHLYNVLSLFVCKQTHAYSHRHRSCISCYRTQRENIKIKQYVIIFTLHCVLKSKSGLCYHVNITKSHFNTNLALKQYCHLLESTLIQYKKMWCIFSAEH